MNTIGLTLDNVDKSVHYLSGSLRITWRINERGSCSFSWRSNIPKEYGTVEDVPDFLPEIGQQIAFFCDGTRIFTGDVGTRKVRQLAPRWTGGEQIKGAVQADITLQALERRLEKRVVRGDAYYPYYDDEFGNGIGPGPSRSAHMSWPAGEVVKDLIAYYAPSEGIVTSGELGDFIEAGDDLNSFVIGQDGPANLWGLISQLARDHTDGYHAWIDRETYLHFEPRESRLAPFGIYEIHATNYRDFELTQQFHDKRNRHYHRIAWEAHDPVVFSFEGAEDPITHEPIRIFNLMAVGSSGELEHAQPARIESMTLISEAGEEFPVSFGTRDINTTGVEWFWKPGEKEVTQHDDADPVRVGETLQVKFRVLGADSVMAEDPTDQAATAGIEVEAPSGIYEKVSEDLTCKDTRDAEEAAATLLAEHSAIKYEMTFATDTHIEPLILELEPGMLIHVQKPNYGLDNEQLLVDELSMSDSRGTILDYSVHCISGNVNPKYTDYAKEGVGSSKKKTQDYNAGEAVADTEFCTFGIGFCGPVTGEDVTYHGNVLTGGTPYLACINSKSSSTCAIAIEFKASEDGSDWVSITKTDIELTGDSDAHLFNDFADEVLTAPGLLRVNVTSGSAEFVVVTLRWKRLPPDAGGADFGGAGEDIALIVG